MSDLTTACALVGGAGVALAFLVYALLKNRFLTHDEQLRRSVAVVTATVAVILGAASLAAIAPNAEARALDPFVVAIPTGFGAYALTALLIDRVAVRRWGNVRGWIATGAFVAFVMMPAYFGFAAVSLQVKIVVVVVVVIVVLTL